MIYNADEFIYLVFYRWNNLVLLKKSLSFLSKKSVIIIIEKLQLKMIKNDTYKFNFVKNESKISRCLSGLNSTS
jgi:hypothetical protein